MDKHPDRDIQIVALPGVFNLCWRQAYMVIEFSAPTARGLTTQRVSDYKLHFAASDDYLTKALPLTQTSELRHHRIFGYILDMIFDRELDYLVDVGVNRVALASNSVSVQLNVLRQGGGIRIVQHFQE